MVRETMMGRTLEKLAYESAIEYVDKFNKESLLLERGGMYMYWDDRLNMPEIMIDKLIDYEMGYEESKKMMKEYYENGSTMFAGDLRSIRGRKVEVKTIEGLAKATMIMEFVKDVDNYMREQLCKYERDFKDNIQFNGVKRKVLMSSEYGSFRRVCK